MYFGQPKNSSTHFNELLENIYTVLDFFNSRIDAQQRDGEWLVEKVLQFLVNNCRSWKGESMKMFTQLRFTYEQESHPEEFFIPYVWQLVLSQSDFTFNPSCINLFSVDQPVEIGCSVSIKSLFDSTKIVAKGVVRSMDPNTEVRRQTLGPNWCEIQVLVVLEREESLIRPYDFLQKLTVNEEDFY
ncbi:uncharacterized protein LOC142532009 [Primulina tabacum]|uniref:uncharacterized protein LOC142532009 n=1 Tax=Primulina tabacum TaxID=48773 RepID=UPI003F59CD36